MCEDIECYPEEYSDKCANSDCDYWSSYYKDCMLPGPCFFAPESWEEGLPPWER